MVIVVTTAIALTSPLFRGNRGPGGVPRGRHRYSIAQPPPGTPYRSLLGLVGFVSPCFDCCSQACKHALQVGEGLLVMHDVEADKATVYLRFGNRMSGGWYQQVGARRLTV